MMDYTQSNDLRNHTLVGSGGVGGAVPYRNTETVECDVMRTFPDLASRVSVAQEAAHAASNELFELMARLGISNNYGTACSKVGGEPAIGGDVDALTRQIDQLTDAVRDIRGLSETLNSRL